MRATPLNYRRATIKDRGVLLAWRNDPTTRAASLGPEEIGPAEHERWLHGVLADPARALFVFEEDGIAVGTVRADFDDAGGTRTATLSWTVAPEARGRGLGKRMLALFVEREARGMTLRAAIKSGNEASISIAESVGMELGRESKGVLHYRRGDSSNEQPGY